MKFVNDHWSNRYYKFASLHPEFKHLVGNSFKDIGIIKLRKHCG